jgi:hypothetical protein
MPGIDFKESTNINIHNAIPGSHGKMNVAGRLDICIGRSFGSLANDDFCDPARQC